MTSALNRLVLQLNSSYEPYGVTSARHAIVLVCKGAACVEVVSDQFVRTPSMKIPVPDVIRMLKYRKVPRQVRSVSRKAILLRDDCRCGYCLRQFPSEELTLDHVIPKSRGGQFTWQNLISCCPRCNNKKRDRTPQEAGMELSKKPIPISIHSKLRAMTRNDSSWSRFLFN